jgi:hypothetical protein
MPCSLAKAFRTVSTATEFYVGLEEAVVRSNANQSICTPVATAKAAVLVVMQHCQSLLRKLIMCSCLFAVNPDVSRTLNCYGYMLHSSAFAAFLQGSTLRQLAIVLTAIAGSIWAMNATWSEKKDILVR